MVVKIILGAVMSQVVVVASPFWGTLLAGFALVGLHQLLAWASFRSEWIGKLVKGEAIQLLARGQPLPDEFSKVSISKNDLLEGPHENGNLSSLDQAEEYT